LAGVLVQAGQDPGSRPCPAGWCAGWLPARAAPARVGPGPRRSWPASVLARVGPGPGGPRPDHSIGGPFLLGPARPGTATMPCY